MYHVVKALLLFVDWKAPFIQAWIENYMWVLSLKINSAIQHRQIAFKLKRKWLAWELGKIFICFTTKGAFIF